MERNSEQTYASKPKVQYQQRMLLHDVLGRELILDKLTQSIIWDDTYMFFGKRRTIPFSDVFGVVIYSKLPWGGILELLRFSEAGRYGFIGINFYGKRQWEMILVASGREDKNRLASAISKFLGK